MEWTPDVPAGFANERYWIVVRDASTEGFGWIGLGYGNSPALSALTSLQRACLALGIAVLLLWPVLAFAPLLMRVAATSFDDDAGLRCGMKGLLATVAVCLLILVSKTWDTMLLPQFWAEDAGDFFNEQFGAAIPALFEPSSGYLHVVPRLVAWVTELTTLRYAPAVYYYAATLLGAASLGLFAWRIRRPVPIWLSTASFLLMPISIETHGTLTNAQWMLQFALAAMVFPSTAHPSRFRTAWSCVAIVALGLTGPFSILIAATLPVLMFPSLRAIAQTSSDARLRLTALCFSAALQLSYIIFSENARAEGGHFRLEDWSLLPSMFSVAAQGHMWVTSSAPLPTWLFCCGLLAIGATLLVKASRSQSPSYWLLALMLAVSVAQALLGVIKNSAVPMDILQQVGVGDRYFIALKIVIWPALAAAVSAALPSRFKLAPAIAVFVVVVVLGYMNFGFMKRPPLVDTHWATHIKRYESGESVSIPINPSPWVLKLDPHEPK